MWLQTPLYLLAASLALLNVKGLLSALNGLMTGSVAGNAMTNALRPVLNGLWRVLKEVFGSKPDSLSFKLEHVLLVACLLAIISVANAIGSLQESTEKQTKAIQHMAAAQQLHATSSADRKKDD